MIRTRVFCLFVAVLAVSGTAMALPIPITFEAVPTAEGGGFNSTNAEVAALEAQLLCVFDVVDSDTVSFTFTNAVGVASSIHSIYFNDSPEGSEAFPGLDFDSAVLTEPTGVSFGLDPVAPPVPGAQLFGSYVAFGVDSQNAGLGIDAAPEYLTITIDIFDGYTTDQIAAAVMDGSLDIGLHVQAIGVGSTSDWFVSKPPNIVPEPASFALMGLAIAGLVASRSYMRSSK